MKMRGVVLLVFSLVVMGGCSPRSFYENTVISKAQVSNRTRSTEILMGLPAPVRPVPVVVYDFQDQTGQFRNNEKYTDYSSAVTRGGYSILVKALLDTGNGDWFTVAERGALKNPLAGASDREDNAWRVPCGRWPEVARFAHYDLWRYDD